MFTTRQLPVPEGAGVRFVSGSVAGVLPAITAAGGRLRLRSATAYGQFVTACHDVRPR